MKSLNEIGEYIKAERIKQHITQLKLAEKTGFSNNYIALIENGKYNPTLITYEDILNGLGKKLVFDIADKDSNIDDLVLENRDVLKDRYSQGVMEENKAIIKVLEEVFEDGLISMQAMGWAL